MNRLGVLSALFKELSCVEILMATMMVIVVTVIVMDDEWEDARTVICTVVSRITH